MILEIVFLCLVYDSYKNFSLIVILSKNELYFYEYSLVLNIKKSTSNES